MENDNDGEKLKVLIDAVSEKKLEYKKDYDEQKNIPLIEKWKSEILEKYGKGGQFYYCKADGLNYYADKDEAIYNKPCPKCNK